MNLSAVYHIYPKTYWQEHVCNKLFRIQESGLFEAGVKLYITIIQPTSEDLNWLKESCNEFSNDIKIFPSEENFVEYEAIKLVKELGNSIDGYTMYFHTKGCSRNAHRDQRIIDWDEMMSFFIIDNWKKCDLWALGILLYMLFIMKSPYKIEKMNDEQILNQILNTTVFEIPRPFLYLNKFVKLPKSIINILTNLLQINPKYRNIV